MNLPLRTLHRVLTIGIAWGAVWAAIFGVLGIVVGIVQRGMIDPSEEPLPIAMTMGAVGLLSGIAFAILLAIAERGRQVREVAPGRAAMWGVLASAIFPLVTGREDQVFLLCPLGALVAMMMVAIARRYETPALT